jgi:polyhydroxyalkanoate synthesis repressor PhaR
MAAQTILIKKYENRRLYDATNSRYVNLEEVAQFVQQGYDVQVVDAASGEDITRLILTQIIAEGAKTSDSNFPLDILRQMVIASGRASQESAIRYTKAMLDLYQSTYRAMVPTINPFEFLQNPVAAAPAPTQPAQAEGISMNASAETGGDDVAKLKARLAELEKAVSSLAPKAASRTPAAKPVRKKPARKAPARKKK